MVCAIFIIIILPDWKKRLWKFILWYLWKTSAVKNAMGPGWIEMDIASIGASINGVETSTNIDKMGIIDDNRPRITEDKVDTVTRKKQIKNANSEIYYVS